MTVSDVPTDWYDNATKVLQPMLDRECGESEHSYRFALANRFGEPVLILMPSFQGREYPRGLAISRTQWITNQDASCQSAQEWARLLFHSVPLTGQERLFLAHEAERRQESEHQRKEVKARQVAQFTAIRHHLLSLPQHVSVLLQKRSQTVFRDEFGDRVTDRWHKVVDDYYRQKMVPIGGASAALFHGPLNPVVVIEAVLDELGSSIEGHAEIGAGQQLGVIGISGADFERACAAVFRVAGYDVRELGRSGDQGADLLVSLHGVATVVQCKCHATSVGNKSVQEAAAARGFYDAGRAMVVANGAFTPSARQLASKLEVELVEFVALAQHANWRR